MVLDTGAETNFWESYTVDPAFRFRPGRGFWALADDAWTISSMNVANVNLDGDGYFLLTLNPGWNLIGNPFEIEVPWEFIRGINDFLSTSAPLYDYNGASFVSVSSFRPYKGYYLNNPTGSTQMLQFPYGAARSKHSVHQSDQHVVTLSLLNDEQVLSEAYIDMIPESSDQLDPYDHEDPRPSMSNVSIRFVPDALSESRLMIESRPNMVDGQRFEIEVTNKLDIPLVLHHQVQDNRAGLSMSLVDASTGALTNLHDSQEIYLGQWEGRRMFELLIGTDEYVKEAHVHLVPRQFSMNQNYPNPFIESTTFEFGLPDSRYLQVEIYDVLGRRLNVIIEGNLPAGRHQVSWDGTDSQGHTLPAGMYFIVARMDNGEEHVLSMVKAK